MRLTCLINQEVSDMTEDQTNRQIAKFDNMNYVQMLAHTAHQRRCRDKTHIHLHGPEWQAQCNRKV